MKKSARIFLLLAAALFFAGLAWQIYQQHRVDSFFRQFVSLKLGTTSFNDVQQLAVQYRARSSGAQLTDPCTPQDCAVTFTFTNRIVRYLLRDREITLAVGLFIKDGHLVSKELDFSIFFRGNITDSMYVLFDRSRPQEVNGYKIHLHRIDAQGVAHFVEAELGSNAPDKLRNQSYLVNLRCLTKILGCDSQADFFPEVWRRSPQV